jgi:hypothetical protein
MKLSMLLTLFFIRLAFFGLGEFGISVGRLVAVGPGQERCIVEGYLMKLLSNVDTLLLVISCPI